MSESDKPGVLIADPRMRGYAARLADAFTIVDEAEAEAGDVIAVITGPTGIVDAALMKLRLIATPTAGLDGIDLRAAAERGVTVTNGGDVHSDDVANHAVALTLAARQQIVAGDQMVRGGGWRADTLPPIRRSIASDRVGIVGMGNIGRAVAARMAVFTPEIGWWGPRPHDHPWPRHDSLRALADWCGILIVCARGDNENAGLISAEIIDAIGAEGLFVNISRGHLVDEDALIAALSAGRLGGAALDVFAQEPTDPARWRDVPNATLTPHSAGLTREAIAGLGALVIGNVRSLLTGGELRNIVAPA